MQNRPSRIKVSLGLLGAFLFGLVLSQGKTYLDSLSPSPQNARHLDVSNDGRIYEFEYIDEYEFQITVINNSSDWFAVTSYYYGYEVQIEYLTGETLQFDFGADKVPVITDKDWHLLKGDMSVSWRVNLSRMSGSLKRAKKVTYRQTLDFKVPRFIESDEAAIKNDRVNASWDFAAKTPSSSNQSRPSL